MGVHIQLQGTSVFACTPFRIAALQAKIGFATVVSLFCIWNIYFHYNYGEIFLNSWRDLQHANNAVSNYFKQAQFCFVDVAV